MVIYRGVNKRTIHGGYVVTKNDFVLSPANSLGVRNHSPDGFNWGYGGSGPAQLALALLLDVTGNEETALKHYQSFKWDVVAKMPRRGWELTENQILSWLGKRGVMGNEDTKV